METKEIIKKFGNDINCAQIILEYFSEDLGLSKEMARKISSAFGAGMYKADICGSISAAYMVLGLKYGNFNENDGERKKILLSKMALFDEKFANSFSATKCKEILGHNLCKEDELKKIMKKGLFTKICPDTIGVSIKILKEIL